MEFVDNARASGEITHQAYERMSKRISAAHQICEIRLSYSSSYQSPEIVQDADGNDKVTYKRHLQEYSNEDIIDYIFPTYPDTEYKDFPMKEGGYISVEVKNITPTLGTQMARMFIPTYSGQTLRTNYGGYVGNSKQ